MIDPNLTVIKMTRLEDQIGVTVSSQRLIARLTTLYGLLALALGSIGMYGVSAYMVARRTSEIGLRMTLGASRLRIVAMVLGNVLAPIALGLAVGLAASWAGRRALASQLYGVSAGDPTIVSVAILVLVACGAAASVIPARRAASIDPLQALRTE